MLCSLTYLVAEQSLLWNILISLIWIIFDIFSFTHKMLLHDIGFVSLTFVPEYFHMNYQRCRMEINYRNANRFSSWEMRMIVVFIAAIYVLFQCFFLIQFLFCDSELTCFNKQHGRLENSGWTYSLDLSYNFIRVIRYELFPLNKCFSIKIFTITSFTTIDEFTTLCWFMEL